MNENLKIVSSGFVRENPMLKLVLGTCPALAVTSMAGQSLALGIIATLVLLVSNVLYSLLRDRIPVSIQIPVYITLIATFVTVSELLVQAYFPNLAHSLGVFLSLVVVNCIILGDIQNPHSSPLQSGLEGLRMGMGFTLLLTVTGILREITGLGTCFGRQALPDFIQPFTIMTSAPGGFFVFGFLIAVISGISRRKLSKVDVAKG